MTAALDVLGGALAAVGAGLILLAALSLHRNVPGPVKLHLAAKATGLGIGGTLFGAALLSGDLAVALELLLAGVFLSLTIPLATHLVARENLPEPWADDEPPGGR